MLHRQAAALISSVNNNGDVMLQINQSITTLQFRELINKFREEAGEKPVRNNDFIKRVEIELGGELSSERYYQRPTGGMPEKYYDLTLAQAVQVITRENPSARRMLSESITDHMEVLKAYQCMDVTELDSDKYVYVIKNLATGAYKVGISKDPEQRLKSLQVGNDGELSLVGYKQGTFQDETSAHKRLADKNIRSEWFRLDGDDVKALLDSDGSKNGQG